jgi:flavin-dependent dehydrogenase
MTSDIAHDHYDIVILGGGMAGLSLARHLLLQEKMGDRRILLVERLAELPPQRQKVGESTVQLAGYYFSKVLDLEEYLLHDQFMKYNLRFYWPTAGRDNRGLEDYSQTYIRDFSNIASYQLDRNTFEAELLRRNRQDPRFEIALGASNVKAELAEEAGGLHTVHFDTVPGDPKSQGEKSPRQLTAGWVVDATGRGRLLARRGALTRKSEVSHGSVFLWVEGLINVEKLTDRSPDAVRLSPDRAITGHLPFWLATNHFTGEGFWLWVIPLRGQTSLGLVYDRATFPVEEVASAEKLVEWICRRFPLFARDLPHRKVTGWGGYRDFAHDCEATISIRQWAMTGEAGRFTDPLYSPGSDLIALHNTLIADAILTEDPYELRAKVRQSEGMMRAFYGAYLPSYIQSYDALGDPETFTLKYTWELSVYFSFYVFPFINDLFTDRRFGATFLSRFARLGPINHAMQGFLSGYFQWKKQRGLVARERVLHDFKAVGPLHTAAETFYQVGLDTDGARRELERQLENLRLLARFTAAHVASMVLDEPAALTNRAFVESFDPASLRFDEEDFRRRWAACRDRPAVLEWPFCIHGLDAFRSPQTLDEPAAAPESAREEVLVP